MEESRGADANVDVPAIEPDSILPLAILPPPPPVGTIPKPRRKPCYGWVSDEDKDIDDVMYVPTRFPEKPRRKIRWDVAPDEI